MIDLQVRRDVAVARGAARDPEMFGGMQSARKAYDDRYMAACDIYIREEHPAERATPRRTLPPTAQHSLMLAGMRAELLISTATEFSSTPNPTCAPSICA